MLDILTLTDQNFDQHVLHNDLPVLVDFWAPWCGPCRHMNPVISAVAEEFIGRLVVAKIDVQDHTMVPARYGIVSIPTFFLFRKGEKIAEMKGSHSEEIFSAWIVDQLA